NRPTGRQKAPGKNAPPTSRRSARQQRLANREANRALAKASTHGSSGGSHLLLIGSTVAIVAVMAIIAGVWFVTRPAPFSEAPIPPGLVTPSGIPSNSTTLGQANAPVTIDLWGDFRCTFCFNFTAVQEPQLVQNYVSTGKAKLVWHDFTVVDNLQSGVTESRDAANAALCAADQGKFWTMHDWLYANQSTDESPGAFTQDRLLTIGKDAGLDTTKYNPCVQQGNHLSAIQAEQTSKPAGIQGTPSILVNGKQIQGPADASGNATVPDYPTIAAAIDAVLNPSASPAASGSVSPSASASASTVPSTAPSTAPTPSASPSASPS
ncbi:MAG TPA: thioredoxin domain-containing protein, partial [Candidatus Limnocylindrales bacterium]